MTAERKTALWWARTRAAGPQRIAASAPGAAGMRRLVEADAAGVWLLPIVPAGAHPTVLDELGLTATAVEQPNDTARALAACLRCCWPEPTVPPWPGLPASWEQVTAVFRMITDNRDERVGNIALVAGVRRLAGSGWLRWSESTREVRLGPRVAAWNDPELSTLRELWRLIPTVTPAGTPAAIPTVIPSVDKAVEKPMEAVENPGNPVRKADVPVDKAVDDEAVDDGEAVDD